MLRPAKIEPLAGYRIRLTYPDGIEGVIDLSGDVGRGVFAPLANEAFFHTVHIGKYGQIAWSEEIEIESGTMYRGRPKPGPGVKKRTQQSNAASRPNTGAGNRATTENVRNTARQSRNQT